MLYNSFRKKFQLWDLNILMKQIYIQSKYSRGSILPIGCSSVNQFEVRFLKLKSLKFQCSSSSQPQYHPSPTTLNALPPSLPPIFGPYSQSQSLHCPLSGLVGGLNVCSRSRKCCRSLICGIACLGQASGGVAAVQDH